MPSPCDVVITIEDYEEMEIELSRRIRTETYEEYIIVSDNLDAGRPIYEESTEENPAPEPEDSVVGFCTVTYVDLPIAKRQVTGFLLLNKEWEEEAYNRLAERIDRTQIGSLGGGSRAERVSFDFRVFQVDRLPGFTADPGRSSIGRGLDKRIEYTHELIEDIPSSVSESIDESLQEHYEEIEEIIQSEDLDRDEKADRIKQQFHIGLKYGFPNVSYDRESEHFDTGG